METTYSVITFLKNNKAGHGRALIYLRITVNGQRQAISIKRKIEQFGQLTGDTLLTKISHEDK